MPVQFETPVYATITMLDDSASEILKMMGQSGVVPGALRSEDIPAAIKSLKSAIKTAARAQARNPGIAAPSAVDDDEDSPVTIANRAVPLIALLEAAEKEDRSVTWQRG